MNSIDTQIIRFIDRLSGYQDATLREQRACTVFNQYSYRYPENAIKRDNLRLYLHVLSQNNSGMMLVGEAPGYRGCRLTGIPFTSEDLLRNSFAPGLGNPGFKTKGSTKEQTASIVWGTLNTYDLRYRLPLLWNAFPFHPHKIKNPCSNRNPTRQELDAGEPFILDLISLFKIRSFVAIGNTAAATLSKIGIYCRIIRHPSFGGKREFAKGIETLYTTFEHNNIQL